MTVILEVIKSFFNTKPGYATLIVVVFVALVIAEYFLVKSVSKTSGTEEVFSMSFAINNALMFLNIIPLVIAFIFVIVGIPLLFMQ